MSSDPSANRVTSTPATDLRQRAWRGLLSVSLWTMLSRVLGLLRDIGMARLWGVSAVMDAFTIGFRIPNLSRRLFGEGALATVLIPVFLRERQADPQRGWQLCSAVLIRLACFLSAVVLAGEIGLWCWSQLGAETQGTLLLMELTAWMLPYLVLICLAGIVGAILNALGQFRWPALVPVVLNVVWLIGIGVCLLTTWPAETQARWLAGCILLAGLLQLVLQWPGLTQAGFRWQTDWHPVRNPLREVLWGVGPVVLGLSITQINTFTDSLIGWGLAHPADQPDARLWLPWGEYRYPLAAGAVSALYFGERMYQFPLGVFGVALGTVLFPLLARHAAERDWPNLRHDLQRGLRLVLAIGIPASAGLIWLAVPLARCFFERGQFGAQATLRTGTIIAAYGSGVWAYCATLILQRCCYAIGDRITPVRSGIVAVVVNLLTNLTLIWWCGEVGLALSTAGCAMLQTAFLLWAVQRQIGGIDWRQLADGLWRTLLATAGMLAVGLGIQQAQLAWQPWHSRWLSLLVPCLLASASYLVLARCLRIDELRWLVRGRKE